MTTINLDTEIVATRHDAAARMNYYTVLRNGRRWTIGVPSADLDRYGKHVGHKQRRANHIANLLTEKMRGEPDAS